MRVGEREGGEMTLYECEGVLAREREGVWGGGRGRERERDGGLTVIDWSAMLRHCST